MGYGKPDQAGGIFYIQFSEQVFAVCIYGVNRQV
jgi:hypothetical protein